MISEQFKTKVTKILIFAGLCIAILSALEPHIEWLSALCGFLGDGCKDTEQFLLFGIPFSIWGIIFYIILLVSFFFARSWIFWLISGGFGVESILIKIMITQNLLCFLCLLNLLILLSLLIAVINRNRIWEALALCFFFFIISDTFLYRANPSLKVSNAQQHDSSVIAIIGGNQIFKSEIEASIAGQLNKLEKKIYNLKRNKLDHHIENILLEMEAKEKNESRKILIRRVLSSVAKISDNEVAMHYQEHKDYYDKKNESIAVIKQKIRTYLQEKRLSGKIKEYIHPLKKKYGVIDFLTPPPMPVTDINVENSPFFGPNDAAVTIIEFSDYLCPSCKRAHKLTKKIKDLYQGKIKWIFKDYPLKRHKGAKRLAAAARCAGEQGKFWEYQDLLFASKEKPSDETLVKYAKALGLNVNLFIKALNNQKYLSTVERDIRDALASGISSTPTFIINGKLSSGTPTLDEFKAMIDQELTD